MSAKDSSALAYVSSLRHGRKSIHSCGCEKCRELCHVLKLATDFVSLKRVAQYKENR